MRTRILLGAIALLSALAFSAPADAVTINGIDYVLFARETILMEQGAVNINGNVAVNEDLIGLLKVGAFNVINGTATAFEIKTPASASITDCEFNKVPADPDLATVCGTTGPAVLPITNWPVGGQIVQAPQASIDACVDAAPDETVPANGVLDLPAGSCRGNVKVGQNATLILHAGATYNFKSLRFDNDAILLGNGALVHLKGELNSHPGVTMDNVTITTVASGFEAIEIGNSNTLTGVVLHSPFAKMHLHTGGKYSQGFEAIAKVLIIEPIEITDGQPGKVCACVAEIVKCTGLGAPDALCKAAGTILLKNGCHLNLPASQLSFWLSTTCQSCPAGPGVCTQATIQAGATDTTGILDIPVVPAGQYHVIAQTDGGFFCTADTVSLP